MSITRTHLSRGGALHQGPHLYHQRVIHNNTIYLAGQTANILADAGGNTYTGQAHQVSTAGGY